MIQFASGVFKGWKHETFGQCFLDYAWLIPEELPQATLEPGGHWKHLFKPVRNTQVQVKRVEGGSRLAVIRPEVTTGQEDAYPTFVQVYGAGRVAKVAASAGAIVSAMRVSGIGRAGRARLRAGATVFPRRVSGKPAIFAYPVASATVQCRPVYGTGSFSRVAIKTVQNLPEEALLALL